MSSSKASIKTKSTKEINIFAALLPLLTLVILLVTHVQFIYTTDDDLIAGPSQWMLMVSGMVALMIGASYKIPMEKTLESVGNGLKSVSSAIIILLLVGALAGSWLIGGIVPAMVYYGLQILSASYFLPAALVLCAIVSLLLGSSWTTTATVGVALMGVGKLLGFSEGIVAGAILSGAYFGDKLSPMSDTTNLASALAGANIFDHIRYMLYTTVPAFLIALIAFTIIGLGYDVNPYFQQDSLINEAIVKVFNINPILFVTPILVIGMIFLRINALVSLFIGVLLGLVNAVIFQTNLIESLSEEQTITAFIKTLMQPLMGRFSIESTHPVLNKLFNTGGMVGMLKTIWLIITAIFFGGVMEGIGALQRITTTILRLSKSIFGLFAGTVGTCIFTNLAVADQYLAIVLPGKMFKEAYKAKGLAQVNLSRTLEDSGTMLSVMVPWNTCGAYHSHILAVNPFAFIPFLIFNYISTLMTLIFAYFQIRLKLIDKD